MEIQDRDGTIGRNNFCSACGNRLQSTNSKNPAIADRAVQAQVPSERSGLARFFQSDVGLSIIAYTGLCGWIAHILPIVDTSTGLFTGAAIGLFRKI